MNPKYENTPSTDDNSELSNQEFRQGPALELRDGTSILTPDRIAEAQEHDVISGDEVLLIASFRVALESGVPLYNHRLNDPQDKGKDFCLAIQKLRDFHNEDLEALVLPELEFFTMEDPKFGSYNQQITSHLDRCIPSNIDLKGQLMNRLEGITELDGLIDVLDEYSQLAIDEFSKIRPSEEQNRYRVASDAIDHVLDRTQKYATELGYMQGELPREVIQSDLDRIPFQFPDKNRLQLDFNQTYGLENIRDLFIEYCDRAKDQGANQPSERPSEDVNVAIRQQALDTGFKILNDLVQDVDRIFGFNIDAWDGS